MPDDVAISRPVLYCHVCVLDVMFVRHLCFRCRKLAGRWRTSSGSATGVRGRARCYTEWISDVRWRQWHIRTAAAATARDATNGPGTAFPRWTGPAHDAPLQRHDATSLCEYLSSSCLQLQLPVSELKNWWLAALYKV